MHKICINSLCHPPGTKSQGLLPRCCNFVMQKNNNTHAHTYFLYYLAARPGIFFFCLFEHFPVGAAGSVLFLLDAQLVITKFNLQVDGVLAKTKQLLPPSHKVSFFKVAEADAWTLWPVAVVVYFGNRSSHNDMSSSFSGMENS